MYVYISLKITYLNQAECLSVYIPHRTHRRLSSEDR